MSTRRGQPKARTAITPAEQLQDRLERLQQERSGSLDAWADVEPDDIALAVRAATREGAALLLSRRGASPCVVVYPPGKGGRTATYVCEDAADATDILRALRAAFEGPEGDQG